MLAQLIADSVGRSRDIPKSVGLSRGVATIPLQGIDVPFHSTFLRPGVQQYRRFLQERVLDCDVHPEKLVGRFIPNIMAKPFSLERAYVEEAFLLTGSPVLKEMLETAF